MLKRFYSKKSGFTLVEIIVAFAVFSIMASMIAQILELAISARNANNLYAKELARQEQLLTVIQKDSAYYNESDKTGTYTVTIGSSTYTMGYQVKATDPTATNQAEGLNYFLSPVDYKCTPSTSGDTSSSDAGGASQASRLDTRITGTQGIGGITISEVFRDTYSYNSDSDYYLPDGKTRYIFKIYVSSKDESDKVTLREEDYKYAQLQLYMYSDQLDAGKSVNTYTDSETKKKYTRDEYQEANITKVMVIDSSSPEAIASKGLEGVSVRDGSEKGSDKNPFTVRKLGENSIRIGSPYGGSGVRFENQPIFFYVEFDGDPNITKTSFGHTYTLDTSGDPVYRACPVYAEEYNDDGTPKYSANSTTYACIYGGYLYTRHYID